MSKKPTDNHFVEDGYDRALIAVEPEIRATVVEEFSDQFAAASFWKRYRLRRQIEREIKRRVDKLIPPHGLY